MEPAGSSVNLLFIKSSGIIIGTAFAAVTPYFLVARRNVNLLQMKGRINIQF